MPMRHDLQEMKERVALIVPAYNEEGRVGSVLTAALDSKLVDEIIVVSDGSGDRTAQVAESFAGVRVLRLPWNMGKGAAMAAGVSASKASIVAFVDADLSGLTGRQVDALIQPVFYGNAGMSVGVLTLGSFWSDLGNQVSPNLSGQRVMRREFFDSLPLISSLRMGAEVAITNGARRARLRMIQVPLAGVRNVHKEQKRGFWDGFWARLRMYREVAEASVRVRMARPLSRKHGG